MSIQMSTECKDVEIPSDFSRRKLLTNVGTGFLLTLPLGYKQAAANEKVSVLIEQPVQPGKTAFIERAFHMRKLAVDLGDQPYGAAVIQDGKIIGQSWSRVILDQDPTAHAEMSAIRDAALRTKNRNFNDSVLYSSSRPCPMCEAAAHWAGIGQMIYGRNGNDAGSPQLCR